MGRLPAHHAGLFYVCLLYTSTGKAKKITVFTYKPKKNSKRKMGHRQPYTKVQIEAVKA